MSGDTFQSAQGFVARLRERADEIESTRHLPADLSKEFARAGFYRMCAPETYGGSELPPAVTMQTIEMLAQGDGSAAWCVFIGATSGTVLATLQPEAAQEIFATPDHLLCGVFAPRGTATAVDDGYKVEGRWAWGSGTRNADWILAGCRVVRDGEIETFPNGVPRPRMFLVPRDRVDLLDTWHVTGLCGTGSTDFEIKDVFVPENHVGGIGNPALRDRPLYAFPQFGLLAMGIAAVALGLAKAAIDELVQLADAKTPSMSGRTLAKRTSTQTDVAKAEALRRSARAFYYEAIEEAWEEANRGEGLSLESRRNIRLATTHATHTSAQAVDLMYHLAGGTSVYRNSPLQRIFRDVHVATQHMMVSTGTLELTGRLLLGLETDVGQL